MLVFFIAGLVYLLRLERVDYLGAYSIPPEAGLLIPSICNRNPDKIARAILRRLHTDCHQGHPHSQWYVSVVTAVPLGAIHNLSVI